MELGSRKLLSSEWLQENEISSSVFLLRALAVGQIGTGGQALVSKPGRHPGARLGSLHPALLSSWGRCQTGGLLLGPPTTASAGLRVFKAEGACFP